MRSSLLAEAFDLRAAEVLCCIGAGGKTTTCWRLLAELCAHKQPSIFTTTTHILEPILSPDTALLLSAEPEPARLRQVMVHVTGLVLAASRHLSPPLRYEELREMPATPNVSAPNPMAPARPCKLAGLRPEQIDRLVGEMPGVTWLVEADGARGRSVKLPAAHEPVLPGRISAVAVLVGLDAIGHPLDEETAHRPERLAEYWHISIGERIGADHITRLMADPAGSLKGVPPGARAIAVLNQRDAARLHPQARSIGGALLASGRYERVITASLRAEQPVLEVLTA